MEHPRRWLPNYLQNRLRMFTTWIRCNKERDMELPCGWLAESSWNDMIIGQDLLLELKLNLYFCGNTIQGNGGVYKGCNAPMKDSYNLCDDVSFRNEELWESEHIPDTTRRTSRILNANSQRSNLSKLCQTVNK